MQIDDLVTYNFVGSWHKEESGHCQSYSDNGDHVVAAEQDYLNEEVNEADGKHFGAQQWTVEDGDVREVIIGRLASLITFGSIRACADTPLVVLHNSV
jgi:GH18 family chitinase